MPSRRPANRNSPSGATCRPWLDAPPTSWPSSPTPRSAGSSPKRSSSGLSESSSKASPWRHDGGPLAQGAPRQGGLDVAVMGVAKFERFFRRAAGVTVDKDDLKRYSDFVNSKLHDLLLIGEATAKANLRDIVVPWDLPVTKGLQETLHVFKKMD